MGKFYVKSTATVIIPADACLNRNTNIYGPEMFWLVLSLEMIDKSTASAVFKQMEDICTCVERQVNCTASCLQDSQE